MKLRINKLISDAGLGSRREAEQFITEGRVTINGQRAKLSDQVEETDVVMLDNVDLPIRDLIREGSGEKIYYEKLAAKGSGKQGLNRTKVKAEQQRLAATPKSAALRRGSKNNPVNKFKRRVAEQLAAEASLDQETTKKNRDQRRVKSSLPEHKHLEKTNKDRNPRNKR